MLAMSFILLKISEGTNLLKVFDYNYRMKSL
jgi:hypothetical protein